MDFRGGQLCSNFYGSRRKDEKHLFGFLATTEGNKARTVLAVKARNATASPDFNGSISDDAEYKHEYVYVNVVNISLADAGSGGTP